MNRQRAENIRDDFLIGWVELQHVRVDRIPGSAADTSSPSSLEALLIMGSFPVQSWTSRADEWDETARFLAPPRDTANRPFGAAGSDERIET